MADDGKTPVSSKGKDSVPSVSFGDNSSLRLTSVKLDGTNYLVWSRSFQLAITARDMSGGWTSQHKWHKENARHDLAY
ncbi:hypothetical protein CsSME_00019909 [Camellia sinensis var. sinensis]